MTTELGFAVEMMDRLESLYEWARRDPIEIQEPGAPLLQDAGIAFLVSQKTCPAIGHFRARSRFIFKAIVVS